MVNVDEYYSHPDKKLAVHINGVIDKVKKCCGLNIAELAAIFHDIGKLNPNFQKKVNPLFEVNLQKPNSYSYHSYLSGISFLCYCLANENKIRELFGAEKEWVASVLAIIVCHHKNLPDFPMIFNEQEYEKLLSFLEAQPILPVFDFLKNFIECKGFVVLNNLSNKKFIQFSGVLAKSINNPLDYFLETIFSFASLIYSDKYDAAKHYEFIKNRSDKFYNNYHQALEGYLNKLESSSPLNIIRTKMRREACDRLRKELKNEARVFSLTAPTGAGKTLMLLSLAGEILKHQNNLRIIYALPFLSITEQVEEVCREVFDGINDHIYRIDSKSENYQFEELQAKLDDDPQTLKEIIAIQFAEDTFDYPFIITTFVRLFETLVSNRNATLLKLPNFSNTIFLIDEIQSLPPRLYGFFVALLEAFCKKFNSYAIISTATMPKFELPTNNKHNLEKFFNNYESPPELISEKYFNEQVFNRYRIRRVIDPISINELAGMVYREKSSVLIILNTIKDTKNLFNILEKMELNTKFIKLILLNTHFTPEDRKNKIAESKELLDGSEKVILISTQLIEAGVDIDFPIVYRDMSPIPNVIQSAGRCNRSGKNKVKGTVVLFELQENGQSRSKLIYKGKDSRFLNLAKEKIIDETGIHEPILFEIQKSFFNHINTNTIFGLHYSKNQEIDFVQKIKEAAFAEIGKFKLIDEQEFGDEYRYYIAKDKNDELFEELEELICKLKQIDYKNFDERKLLNINIENHLKKMADRIVQVRLSSYDVKPVVGKEQCCGIYKLPIGSYNSDKGITLSSENQIL